MIVPAALMAILLSLHVAPAAQMSGGWVMCNTTCVATDSKGGEETLGAGRWWRPEVIMVRIKA